MSFTKKCLECEKLFEVSNPGGYKYTKIVEGHKKYFCGYTCYNKFLKKLNEQTNISDKVSEVNGN